MGSCFSLKAEACQLGTDPKGGVSENQAGILESEVAAKAATGSSSSGAEASLKKDKSHPKSLKKDVPLVIIDWHNLLHFCCRANHWMPRQKTPLR